MNSPQNVYAVFLLFLIANLIMIPLGILTIKVAAKLLKVPRNVLMPIILLFCIVGAFAINNATFDLYILLGFGLLAWFLEANDFPIAPLILGMLLGHDAGGALHPLDDQGRGQPDGVRRAADRGGAGDLHRAAVGRFGLARPAPQFDRARRRAAPRPRA